MSTVKPTSLKTEPTPVDDVRRVREKLSKETDGDVARLIDHARNAAKSLRDKLGLKPADR